jgi:ribosomal-protein-alanine N-acetyltransferase
MYTESLTTQRMITRKLVPSDQAVWSDFLADPESSMFLSSNDFPTASDHAVFWIKKQLERYESGRYGLHALLDRRSGEFIGQCGLITQEVAGKEELEIGYHILGKFRGLGLATEAARAFRNFAFGNLLTDSLVSIIHTGNLASEKVASRNGMLKEQQMVYNGMPVHIFRISYDSWKTAPDH